jgi:hypothetical protein
VFAWRPNKHKLDEAIEHVERDVSLIIPRTISNFTRIDMETVTYVSCVFCKVKYEEALTGAAKKITLTYSFTLTKSTISKSATISQAYPCLTLSRGHHLPSNLSSSFPKSFKVFPTFPASTPNVLSQ